MVTVVSPPDLVISRSSGKESRWEERVMQRMILSRLETEMIFWVRGRMAVGDCRQNVSVMKEGMVL